MKKILVGIGILILLVVVGLGIFIATFNADQYRPLAEKQIEAAVGHPVRLGRLELAWAGGLALAVKGLEILPERGAQNSLLSLEEARAVLDPFALLKKEIQIGSIVLIRPRVELVQDAAGQIKISGIEAGKKTNGSFTPPPSQSLPLSTTKMADPSSGGHPAGGGLGWGEGQGEGTVPPSPVSPAAQVVPFFIREVEVEKGELRYSSRSGAAPVSLALQNLDLRLRNVSLVQPMSFEAKGSVASSKQNVTAGGRLLLPVENRAGVLEEFQLKLDLNAVEVRELARAVPALVQAGDVPGFAGDLEVRVDRLVLDEAGLAQSAAHARITRGKFTLPGVQSPIENVEGEAVLGQGRIQINRLSGIWAGGTIGANGTTEGLGKPQPASQFQATLAGLNLDQMFPSPGPEEPGLNGRLAVSFQGNAFGLGSQLSQSLTGQGRIQLQDGVLINFNLLREVFDRLSIIPGLVNRLHSRLPPDYRIKLEAKDTILGPIDQPLAARGGVFYLDNLQVVSESFLLNGNAAVRADGVYSVQAVIRIEPQLSSAFIQSVTELQYLTDREGRLEIPVRIESGPGGEPRIIPDLVYVGQKLALTKAQEWIGGLLGKKESPTTQTSPQSPPAETQPQEGDSNSQGDVLGELIGGFFNPKKGQTPQ